MIMSAHDIFARAVSRSLAERMSKLLVGSSKIRTLSGFDIASAIMSLRSSPGLIRLLSVKVSSVLGFDPMRYTVERISLRSSLSSEKKCANTACSSAFGISCGR